MLFFASLLTFSLCYVLVPPVIGLSWRIGAVDVPMDWRRMHPESIPRAGGLAIYLSFVIGCLLLGRPSLFLSCTLGGAALMLAVGLADDIFCLGATVKFFFQISIAVATVLGSGVAVGWRAFAAVLWVLTLTNAHNFIDGLDGLFAGSAAVESVMLGVSFLLVGAADSAAIPLLLGASCLAFRQYNRFPAQTFAGDCGSGTVGFLLGMLSLPLWGSLTPSLGLLVPLFLFAYPLTDLVTAVLRRLMRGKSPFAADRAHLHHRIVAAGVTHPQCVSILVLLSAALGSVGVLLSTEQFHMAACLACLATAVLLMRIRQFIVDFA